MLLNATHGCCGAHRKEETDLGGRIGGKTNVEKGTELDVKTVCTTNVIALSFIWQCIHKKVCYTLLLNSLLYFVYNNAIYHD